MSMGRMPEGEPKHPDTPADVVATAGPPEPVWDAALGIDVAPDRTGTPAHRLVAIGDSLTHGFQSGAIFNTELSYPAIVARELGPTPFRYPGYPGFGGLPFNLELAVRELEAEFGRDIGFLELGLAGFRLRQLAARIEDWWERGAGAEPPILDGIHHNLGVYGWDLRDVLDRTARRCREGIERPTDGLFRQLVEDANERAALRVLPTEGSPDRTVLDCARELGADGDGIETLIVMLGANNVLGAVTDLRVAWSADGYDTLNGKRGFTVWRPTHFRRELDRVVAEVRRIRARHVIWATVPHVTIAPIARGVQRKVRPGSRYFPYYTRPWISDDAFEPSRDPCITESQARDVDRAVDQYNDAIVAAVRAAREGEDGAPRDWYVLDLAGILDRLAQRRYLTDTLARPPWWRPYELPPELAALDPVPDSCFLAVDERGRRTTGGLFSLDGVHPTTIGYGVIAQEVIDIMRRAGVPFFHRDGATPRQDPVRVNFPRLLGRDTLVGDPPASLSSNLRLIGWLDERLDVFSRVLRVG
jgi:hypothetical protein